MKTYLLSIEGMGCINCVRGVENALKEAGADVISVEIGTAKAAFAGEAVVLKNAVEDIGFDVLEIKEA